MIPILLVVGFLEFGRGKNSTIPWVQSVIFMVWFAGYGLTIGPIPYVIASETSATRLRMKTISISRNFFYIMNMISTISSPYMLNPANGNLKGKAAFPAAAVSCAVLVWAYFRLPECKGRTYEELDIMFERRISARKVKNYTVDIHAIGDILKKE
jgi:SP family general alpha glucoside:H+ symporter-like MFS transporter